MGNTPPRGMAMLAEGMRISSFKGVQGGMREATERSGGSGVDASVRWENSSKPKDSVKPGSRPSRHIYLKQRDWMAFIKVDDPTKKRPQPAWEYVGMRRQRRHYGDEDTILLAP